MIVEENVRKGWWCVYDRGRQFTIMREVAVLAYRDNLRRLREQYRAQMFVANVDIPTTMTPHLPSMREFLELFASEEWDRKRMLPVEEVGP